MSCTWLNPIALPFAVLLMWLYRLFQGAADNQSTFAYAFALILIAIIVRVILLPAQMKSKRGMLKQTRLQPKLNELQKRHGANKQKYNEEMAKLYKEEGVNPASGCLWSFIQMPIMLALFYAIRQPLSLMMGLGNDLWAKGGVIYDRLIDLFNRGQLSETGGFYKELTNYLGEDGSLWPQKLAELESLEGLGFYHELYAAHEISEHWEVFKNLGIEGLSRISFYLGNVNLAEVPNWRIWELDWSGGTWLPGLILFFLPIISGASQFLSAHINRKTMPQPTAQANQGGANTIMKFMPLMSVWFGFILPGALSIYWTIGTGLQIAQDLWLTKRYTRILDEEDAANAEQRRKREEEIEAKRLETERLKAEGLLAENRNTSKRKKQKSEKQEQREKAAEWEKKKSPTGSGKKEEKDEPGRVDNRRYARGRAYDPDRYSRTYVEQNDENNDERDNHDEQDESEV